MQLELFPNQAAKALNQVGAEDRAFHSWYRFVLSFPPHLVRQYVDRLGLQARQRLLDPFCGTGTTVIEAQLQGLAGVGIEANPMAQFASQVKTRWQVDPEGLIRYSRQVADAVTQRPEFHSGEPLRSLPTAAQALLLKNSISPRPLHKALLLLEQMGESPYRDHGRLALAQVLVARCSNLRFMPEVGVRGRLRQDAPVLDGWLQAVSAMAADIRRAPAVDTPAVVYSGDARTMACGLAPASIDGVFTSPPYPNEKDYTRATRLEAVLLGFVGSKQELRSQKKGLVRSNSRSVYRDDDDAAWIARYPRIEALAAEIEQRRQQLGKTSGFTRLYGQVTRHYFGGMARHLAALRPYLKPGARLGYVVGDQASYLQVMIRTGQLLGEIAVDLGYELEAIELFRTRLAATTQQPMREEVVVLRWPG